MKGTAREDQKVEAMFKSLVDGPAALAVASGGRLVYVNSAFLSMYRLTSAVGVKGKPLSQFFDEGSVREVARALRRTGLSENKNDETGVRRIELLGRRNDGEMFPCDCWCMKTTVGRQTWTQLSLVDSTERKGAVEKLTTENAMLHLLQEHAAEALAVIRDGAFSLVNPAFLTLFGFNAMDDVVGKPVGIVDGSRKNELSRILTAAPSGELACECKCRRTDGSLFDGRAVVQKADAGGEATVATFYDITEAKLRDQKIQGYEWGWRVVDELSTTFSLSPREPGVFEEVVTAAVRALSCHIGAMYLMNDSGQLQLHSRVNYPESLSRNLAVIPADEGFGGFAVKTKEPLHIDVLEYPSFLPHRALFEQAGVRRLALTPLTCDERVVGVLLVASRERKPLPESSSELLATIGKQIGGYVENVRNYEEIRRMFEGQRALVESLADVVYSRMADGSVTYISPGVERLLGYKQNEFYRTGSLWLTIVHPEDKKEFFLPAVGGGRSRKTFVTEYRLLPKGKAEYRWVRDASSVVEDSSGTVTAINGTLSEVTDQRERDLQLQKETVPA